MHCRSEPIPCLRGVQVGAGRRVGEQSEQFWAHLKPLTSRQRYMAQCHRRDFLDDAVGLWAEEKFWGFLSLELGLYHNANKCIGEPPSTPCSQMNR